MTPLPVTAELYRAPDAWGQVKGDPAIRFNGMAGLAFSRDGSLYMPHHQSLGADTGFWFGVAA